MFSVIWAVLFDNGRMPILYSGVFLFSVCEFGVCVWCARTAMGAVGTICLPIESRGCFIILCLVLRREGLSLNLGLCWHWGSPSDALVSAPHMTEVIGVGSHTELFNEGARELNPGQDCTASALTRWAPCLFLRIYLLYLCYVCVFVQECVCLLKPEECMESSWSWSYTGLWAVQHGVLTTKPPSSGRAASALN